ncbi:MAG: tRNA pseudouridine(55) synthase TruB [Eubacterium sp.]
MRNGIIIVKKEKGFTSFDVVAKMRGICGQKKIGHTGTLDPDATGVLPVCLGKATKICELLAGTDKEYEASLRLGITTDTQDSSGTVTGRFPTEHITPEEVCKAAEQFRGFTEQIPPMYSALKVRGKKLYELARQGIEIERKPRRIHVSEIAVTRMCLPELSLRIVCSKGTYIRTICHDLGQKLSCGAVMTELQRTRVAGFRLEQAHTLDEIQDLRDRGDLDTLLIPVDRVFGSVSFCRVRPEWDVILRNGGKVPEDGIRLEDASDPLQGGADAFALPSEPDWIRMYLSDGTFVGIYHRAKEASVLRPLKMFL